MMFKSGLVAVVVCGGKIVREMNGNGTSTVYLPFGCEYSIRFKNHESRRAVVSASIDGTDVLGGDQLVVDANSESEIKGFLDPHSRVAKNAFRFIEKTDKISDHRGDKIDDGIIRIEFQFEEPEPYYPPYRPPQLLRQPYPWVPNNYPPIWNDNSNHPKRSKGIRGSSLDAQCLNQAQEMSFNCSANACDSETAGSVSDVLRSVKRINEAGITVAGSHVNQKFGTTYVRRLEPTKHVIVFELKGAKSDGQPIVQPILSRKKVVCPTCGRQCKSSNKFCGECSTALV